MIVRNYGDRVTNRVGVRCSAAWAEWLDGLALHVDADFSTIIAQALYRYAEGVGYNAPPPPRLSRRREPTILPPAERAAFNEQPHPSWDR